MAKVLPKVFYGLHMVEGVAEYSEPEENNGEPYRILLSENVLKNMDPTYEGRPVFVRHVDEVNLSNLEAEADGYVVRSFFNQPDGKHWVQFIVVSDEAQEAIAKGWKLSNAYHPKQYAPGGKWHNVDYAKEVMDASYDHLAIVPDPRYEESIILTPEDFKAYNSNKEAELRLLANSKGDEKMEIKFWKRTKVENSSDLENTVVQLKSGKQITIAELVKNADEAKEAPKANEEEKKVKVNEDEMTVNELVEKHKQMSEKMNALVAKYDAMAEKHGEEKYNAESDVEALEKIEELEEHEVKEIEEEKKNEDGEKELEKKKNEEKAVVEEKKANAKKKADAVRNAGPLAQAAPTVDLSTDKVARGKSRYGSN